MDKKLKKYQLPITNNKIGTPMHISKQKTKKYKLTVTNKKLITYNAH